MTNILYENLYLANKQLNNNLAIGDTNLNSSNTYGTNLKNKAAVYQLVNLKNRKTYIGSTVDLYRRLYEYLNPLYLKRNLKKGNSKIINALLKYGYSNFGLKILEFVELDENLTISDKKKTNFD
jgi:flavin-dependent dehydrogenase